MSREIVLPNSFGKLELGELIGAGSYGKVYRAIDGKGMISAIKIINIPENEAEENALRIEFPDDSARYNYIENLVKGMKEEIETLTILKNNKNVVGIQNFEVQHEEDSFFWTIFIKMELLTPLTEYLTENVMREEDIIKLGIDICSALKECERRGILHRDIKIENIMVSGDGSFKLGDFGLARQLNLLTSSLSIKGSFAYMSPEVFHGRDYNHLADQYSLGMVLYRLLNKNRDPFVDTTSKIVYSKMKEDSLSRRMKGEIIPSPVDASAELASIICKACSYEPVDRFSSMTELSDRLEELCKPRSYEQSENQDIKNVIYAGDESVILGGKEKILLSAWIFPMLLASIFSVCFLISIIVNDSIYWKWIFYAELHVCSFKGLVLIAHVYIPILLSIISLAIPLFMGVSRKSKIRHRILIALGGVLFLLSIIINVSLAAYYELSISVFALYCLLTLVISLCHRKSIIAESIYGHSKEYKDMLSMKKKKDDYEKSVKRNKKNRDKVIKENQIYTKAISNMKKDIK